MNFATSLRKLTLVVLILDWLLAFSPDPSVYSEERHRLEINWLKLYGNSRINYLSRFQSDFKKLYIYCVLKSYVNKNITYKYKRLISDKLHVYDLYTM